MRAMIAAGAILMGAAALAGCAQRSLPAAIPVSAVAATNLCVGTTIPIYFEEGSDRLTAPALQALSSATQPLQQCRIREVVVVGLTQGDPTPANQQLSENRALQVTRALAAQGMPAPRVEAFAGAAPGSAEPMQRRTEIIVVPEPG